jgi:integrase
MPVRRDPRNGGWFFRSMVRMPDGRRVRIFGVPATYGLPNTKVGATEAERREILRVINTGVVKPKPPPKKEVPTVRAFAPIFLEASRVRNKPSSVESKQTILERHVLPVYGDHKLDALDYAAIEDLKVALAKKVSAKTTNNVLTCLRRMLVVARKRGLIDRVPEVEWLKAPPPAFDFLTFEEADRLIAAAQDEWRAMILVALRTGLRQSELLGLRWEDVDLVAGRITVRQAIVRGRVGTPKSGKAREVALGDEVIAALKRQRHLRGPLVFCDEAGRALTKGASKHPLWRACKKAGLRRIGWHVCRHTFASHLVMRGATLKVVQELLGHATITMTMRYAHLAPEIKRDAVRLLDSGSRGSHVAASPKTAAK